MCDVRSWNLTSGSPPPAHGTLRFAPHMIFSLAGDRCYAMSRTLMVPSVSMHTMKGTSAVVAIGVDRHGVGRDNTG